MSRLAREFDPDTPPPPSPSVDSPALGGASQAAADHVAADSSPSSGGASGPLSPTSLAADVDETIGFYYAPYISRSIFDSLTWSIPSFYYGDVNLFLYRIAWPMRLPTVCSRHVLANADAD